MTDEVAPDEATIERLAEAGGLARALAAFREDVVAAARAAAGYQTRRPPVTDLALEPTHVCRFGSGPATDT